MDILFDGWHLRGAHSGGGIARDSLSLARGLSQISNLKVLKSNNDLETLFDSPGIKRHSNRTLKVRSVFGGYYDAQIPTDIFWVSQALPLYNSQALKNVYRIHDLFPITNPEWFPDFQKKVFLKQFRRILHSDAIFVANSNHTAQQLSRLTKISSNRIRVFSCKVEKMDALTCNTCEACKFNETNPTNYNFMVGTVEPRKNYSLPISIYLESKHLDPLVIVGRKGWKSKKISKLLINTQNVMWLQSSCNGALRRLFENAKRFISTSLDEGFNLPAAEANLFSVPSLLSDIPVHRELYPYATFVSLESQEDWISHLENKVSKNHFGSLTIETDVEFQNRLRKLVESFNE